MNEREILQETDLDLSLLVLRSGPDLVVEDLLADFEEHAFVRDDDREHRAEQAVATVKRLVADDATRRVLRQVLELQRVLIVIP